jgi:hypothetical protein
VPEVAHEDDFPISGGQPLDRIHDGALLHRLLRSVFERLARILQHVFVSLERLTLVPTTSDDVHTTVRTDSAEPRSDRPRRVEVANRPIRLQEGVLNRIVGVVGVAEHPRSHRDKRRSVEICE